MLIGPTLYHAVIPLIVDPKINNPDLSKKIKGQIEVVKKSLKPDFSNYDYWIGKSYILIAEIFISMDEMFQANATLESLIENTQINEIKDRASELKNKIIINE